LFFFLNGENLGNRVVPYLGKAEWNVSYISGNLTAVAYNVQNQKIGSSTVQTTEEPFAILLSADTPTEIQADGHDVALIRVSIVDSKGLVVPTANNYITFAVAGEGTLLGVGNGDPACTEPDKGSGRSAFGGLARAILQSTTQPGTIVLSATAEGLQLAKIQVLTRI